MAKVGGAGASKAAYLAKSMSKMAGLADLSVCFLGSDLFSEFYDTDKILYGGTGLISKDGIFKPSFYTFKYYGKAWK